MNGNIKRLYQGMKVELGTAFKKTKTRHMEYNKLEMAERRHMADFK